MSLPVAWLIPFMEKYGDCSWDPAWKILRQSQWGRPENPSNKVGRKLPKCDNSRHITFF